MQESRNSKLLMSVGGVGLGDGAADGGGLPGGPGIAPCAGTASKRHGGGPRPGDAAGQSSLHQNQDAAAGPPGLSLPTSSIRSRAAGWWRISSAQRGTQHPRPGEAGSKSQTFASHSHGGGGGLTCSRVVDAGIRMQLICICSLYTHNVTLLLKPGCQ
jgi:hypothetical protein